MNAKDPYYSFLSPLSFPFQNPVIEVEASVILVNRKGQQLGFINNGEQQIMFEISAGVEPITISDQMRGTKLDCLLGGIYQHGFLKPSSSMQQRAVLPNIRSCNVIAQAPSGTRMGSSMTNGPDVIAVVACQIVDTKVHALTLSSTRKISSQTMKVILAILIGLNVQAHACDGGKSKVEVIRKLKYGVHFVSGTCGRVCKRRTLHTRAIKLLEKSDAMLIRGFKDQIHDVHRHLLPELQVYPIRMLAKCEEMTSEELKQFFFAVEKEEWKIDALCNLHHTLIITQAVVFCITNHMVLRVAAQLTEPDSQPSAPIAPPAVSSRRKKKSDDDANFLEDVKNHIDEFVNASMDEHKTCLDKTIQKMFGMSKVVAEMSANAKEVESSFPLQRKWPIRTSWQGETVHFSF